MNRPALLIAAAWLAAASASSVSRAQDTKPATAVPAPPVMADLDRPEPDPQTRGEPNVKRTVIEDGGSKVEELRVRGQTQRITVTPKVGGMKPYEILNGDASRDLLEAPDSTRGAAGKRVWHVLSF